MVGEVGFVGELGEGCGLVGGWVGWVCGGGGEWVEGVGCGFGCGGG